MSGLSKQLVKKGTKNLISMRKIRVLYTDPDATDYSSEEDGESSSNGYQLDGSKRFVKKILVPKKSCAGKIKKDPSFVGSCSKRNQKSSSFRGVRRRKWGTYVAEIRDPFQGVRLWLGTYSTEKEAAMVYERKKKEFERLESEILFPHSSPSSVLEASVKKEKASTEATSEEGDVAVEAYFEDGDSIQHLLEEPVMPSLENREMQFDDTFGYFFNNGIDADVENGEAISLPPPVESDFSDSQLAWIDEALNYEWP